MIKMDGKVKITKDGPYLVSGGLPLAKEIAVVGRSGQPEEWNRCSVYPEKESYALCRCGRSKNPPFCDGTHVKVKFEGTETAEMACLKGAVKLSGPKLELIDAQNLCASARFCHLAGGTWNNVRRSDDPGCRNIAIQTAGNCPAGRLVVLDKRTKKPIEPKFEKSIGLIEDPQAEVSGPIWIKGGVKLESADGKVYKTGNRCTVCRCGKSDNKPFCDGTHVQTEFNDGDESLR